MYHLQYQILSLRNLYLVDSSMSENLLEGHDNGTSEKITKWTIKGTTIVLQRKGYCGCEKPATGQTM